MLKVSHFTANVLRISILRNVVHYLFFAYCLIILCIRKAGLLLINQLLPNLENISNTFNMFLNN